MSRTVFFRAMAPKRQAPVGRHPDVPEWTTAMAARVNAVGHELLVQERARMKRPRGPPEVSPTELDSPTEEEELADAPISAATSGLRLPEPPGPREHLSAGEALAMVPGHLDGVAPRCLPRNQAEELAALRFGAARPQSFAPWRHAGMVCGRPVVAQLSISKCSSRSELFLPPIRSHLSLPPSHPSLAPSPF